MSDSTNEPNNAFLRALKAVLSPLVRLVVRFGVTYPEFLELLKRVYVDEVRRELKQKNEKVTLIWPFSYLPGLFPLDHLCQVSPFPT